MSVYGLGRDVGDTMLMVYITESYIVVGRWTSQEGVMIAYMCVSTSCPLMCNWHHGSGHEHMTQVCVSASTTVFVQCGHVT